MPSIVNILNIAELVLAVLIMALILIQNRGAGLGGVFGGEGNVYRTKRGAEKIIFVSTIVVVVLFLGIALVNITLQSK